MRFYAMEFLGTFFLVLAIGLTEGDPLAIGLMLTAMVYAGGHVSGGHYNPAVTLAVFLRGIMSRSLVPGYMLAQLCGAVIASFLLLYFGVHITPPMPAPDAISLMQVALIELLITFVFCFVILAVSTSARLRGNAIYGLAIGFTLFVGIVSARFVSGGVLNPAVMLGTTLFGMAMKTSGVTISILLAYLGGQFAGGALAAYAFRYFNPDEYIGG